MTFLKFSFIIKWSQASSFNSEVFPMNLICCWWDDCVQLPCIIWLCIVKPKRWGISWIINWIIIIIGTLLMLASSIGGLRAIILDASTFGFYQWATIFVPCSNWVQRKTWLPTNVLLSLGIFFTVHMYTAVSVCITCALYFCFLNPICYTANFLYTSKKTQTAAGPFVQ